MNKIEGEHTLEGSWCDHCKQGCYPPLGGNLSNLCSCCERGVLAAATTHPRRGISPSTGATGDDHPAPGPTPAHSGAPVAGEDARVADLTGWWRSVAESEIEAVVAKAIEYGATDLEDLGYEVARINGWNLTKAQATEVGIYVYLRGKVSRWTAALTEGRMVSDDTLHDIGVYVRMAQRAREVGAWPGV